MSDLDALVSDLESAAEHIVGETKKVASKGALNIKNDWRKKAAGYQLAPGLARTISYDVSVSGAVISAEIGPTVGGSGSLGGIYEYGTVNNAPQPAGRPALAAEAPRFEEALGALGQRLLDGR